MGGFSGRSPRPPEVASTKGSFAGRAAGFGDLGVDFGEHKAVRAAGKAGARQALILEDVDAQRGPCALARLERDSIGLVIGIRTRRHYEALTTLALGTERAIQIEVAIHGFVVVNGELRAVDRGGRGGPLIGPGQLAGLEIRQQAVFPGPTLLLQLLRLRVEATARRRDPLVERGEAAALFFARQR